jgi:uncharacterized membrane protein
MELGPVQLMVIGFDHPDFHGTIAAELARLSDVGLIRVLDAMIVMKDAAGVETVIEVSELEIDEATELGATIGALIGLGMGGEEGAEIGAILGAEGGADGHVLDDLDLVDVLGDIPPDSAAAIILIEHKWSAGLRDAIVEADGVPIIDMWVHPLDLVAIGLAEADAAGA